MTNPGDDADQTTSSDSDGIEQLHDGPEQAPEQSQQAQDKPDEASEQSQQAQDQSAPAYEQSAPPYEQPGYPPPATYDGSGYQPTPGFAPGNFPPPERFPPPGQPGYAPPYADPGAGYGTPPYPPPPPGYPPPGYGAPPPGYGPPPPGYPAPGYGAYAAPGQKTNALAIASLVASIVTLCGIGSIAGIVLGIVALNQITQSGEAGRGLAIAGIAVGAVTLLLSMIWFIGLAAS